MLSLIMTSTSCEKNQAFLYDFHNNIWSSTDSVLFSFNIFDTLSPKDISFFLRNNVDYPYRNIFLFVEISNEQKVVETDTVQYLISNKYGQWLGRGFGKTRDNYYIFKKDYQFENAGNHIVVIRHGMRKNNLNGVVKLGFEID